MVGRRCDNVTNNNSLLFGDWRGGLFLARLLIDQCGGRRRRRRTVVNNDVIIVAAGFIRSIIYSLLKHGLTTPRRHRPPQSQKVPNSSYTTNSLPLPSATMVTTRTANAITQQQNQQRLRRLRTRRRQPHRATNMKSSSKTITAGNGLITHFNISDEHINELSKRVPIIGERYRSVRHVFTNDVKKYAPKELFHEIVNEIKTHLRRDCNIDDEFKSSENGNWVVAPRCTSSKARSSGDAHRDTTQKCPGYLTALILLGKRKEEHYGDITIYANSQEMKLHLRIFNGNEKTNLNRAAKNGRVTKEKVKRVEFNCVVFDSRLIHSSHVHTQHSQRTVFAIQLHRKKLAELKQSEITKLEDGKVGQIES